MSYQEYLQSIEKKEKSSQDLVFVCPTCNLKMPHIPRPGGKKQCPRCGDPLSIVGTVFVPISESVRAAEELEKLLNEFESHSQNEGLRATAAKCGSKTR